jgi:hypothetical protein
MTADVLASEELVELAPRLETNRGGFAVNGASFSLINLALSVFGDAFAGNGVVL